MKKIAFCGMTHLGLCYSSVSAEIGYEVVCFDEDRILIDDLKNNILKISEPGLKDTINKNINKLSYTYNINDLMNCKLIFISLDINTKENGESDLSGIKKYISLIESINKNNVPIIIHSQVPPGYTRSINSRYLMFYQVETLVFGDAISRARNPERIIIGVKNKKEALPQFYKEFLAKFECPKFLMNYESAELAKISINCYLSAQVSTTNTLVELATKLGANWNDIVPTLKSDKRIGEFSYLQPGLGISGGNLERDLKTILSLGSKKSTNINFINSIVNLSSYSKKWIEKLIKHYLNENTKKNIAILGLAYKKDTSSIKNSPSINLIENFSNIQFRTYDPAVKKIYNTNVEYFSNAYECLLGTDILVLATPWEEFKSLDVSKIKKEMKGNIIIDPYNLLDDKYLRKNNFRYHSISLTK